MLSPSTRRSRMIGRLTAVPAAAAVILALTSMNGTAPSASATIPPPPSGWTTVFSDDFSGDAGTGVGSQWTYDTGTQYSGSGCTANWGTGEIETNTSATDNVAHDGEGHLNITPINNNGSWTSGRIETVASNFAAPAGGQLQVTASIKQPNPPNGLGYWPAFWMLGSGFRSSGAGTSGTMTCSNWPSTGEIDIMEDVNALSQHSSTLHCGTAPGGPCNEFDGITSGQQNCPGCDTSYHTYTVIVDRTDTSNEQIRWYLDGNQTFSVSESQVGTAVWQNAVDHGFFLILDVAIGGSYPNKVCSCTAPTSSTTSGSPMSVDYVAVYTKS